MLQTKVTSLPGHIQAVYVQNIAKLYAKLLASEAEEVCDLILVKPFFTLKIDHIRFSFFCFYVFKHCSDKEKGRCQFENVFDWTLISLN